MTLNKNALIYDIENMAFTIADTGEESRHTLHRVRDICQDGNIDRVARVLGLAYANLLSLMLPILEPPRFNIDKDQSCVPHNYNFKFRGDHSLRFLLTKERKLKIKETAHEYMVALVLADWLEITLPEAADVWKFRASEALESLKELLVNLLSSLNSGFKRSLSPF
ncbi:MAG: hypothetical protein J1E16_06410 [Muribaculaceae bacterium]|nr:hypothetical protein [Muribaculaceae bacterium]